MMTLTKTDLPHFRWSLTVFLISLVVSVSTAVLSENFVAHAQRNHQIAQRQLNEARNQLAAAKDDRANMATYAKEYAALLDRKIIGGDQRLDWIEGLEKIRRLNLVPEFKYTIAPQQLYTPVPPLDSGNFDLNLSGMSLQLDLLHEGQLINFFDALRKEMKGRFILDHCAMERSGIASSDTRSAPQLKAECSGGWLTLKNRNTQP